MPRRGCSATMERGDRMTAPKDFTAILAKWEAKQPDAVAMTFGGSHWTWAELAGPPLLARLRDPPRRDTLLVRRRDRRAQQMGLARAGRAPEKKARLVDISGDEARQQGDELGVAARKEIGKTRRLGRRELEYQLFHRRRSASVASSNEGARSVRGQRRCNAAGDTTGTARNRCMPCAGAAARPAARHSPGAPTARRRSRTAGRRRATQI